MLISSVSSPSLRLLHIRQPSKVSRLIKARTVMFQYLHKTFYFQMDSRTSCELLVTENYALWVISYFLLEKKLVSPVLGQSREEMAIAGKLAFIAQVSTGCALLHFLYIAIANQSRSSLMACPCTHTEVYNVLEWHWILPSLDVVNWDDSSACMAEMKTRSLQFALGGWDPDACAVTATQPLNWCTCWESACI